MQSLSISNACMHRAMLSLILRGDAPVFRSGPLPLTSVTSAAQRLLLNSQDAIFAPITLSPDNAQ